MRSGFDACLIIPDHCVLVTFILVSEVLFPVFVITFVRVNVDDQF